MAPSFEEIFQSRHFTFVVGEERNHLTVHAAAIAATSEAMDRLVNEPVIGCAVNAAELPDVRYDDFIRFCEFAYRGDYTAPSSTTDRTPGQDGNSTSSSLIPAGSPRNDQIPQKSSQEPENQPDSLLERHSNDDEPVRPSRKRKRLSEPTKLFQLRSEFCDGDYLFGHDPHITGVSISEPQANATADQDFTEVLLAHARLYAFAKRHLIKTLKVLTLHKLHRTLLGFRLYPRRVRDIVQLTKYAYSKENIPEGGRHGVIDDLRNLVITYITCEIDKIKENPEFEELLEGGGEFALDIFGLTCEQLK